MSDIEEFLRRAAERRARGQQSTIEIVEPLVEPIEAEVIDAEAAEVAPERRAELAASKFALKLSRFGQRMEEADSSLAARLHATFDHELGTLRRPEAVLEPEQATPAAGDLFEMLRSPQSVRQAIVLGEILQPLRDRW